MLVWTQRGWLELSVSGCRQQNKHLRLQHNIQQKGVITLMCKPHLEHLETHLFEYLSMFLVNRVYFYLEK